MDVHAWPRGLGLDRYAEAFAANDVDGAVLRTLVDDDLKELGVVSLGHRKKLLAAIADLTTATREFCDVVRRFVRTAAVEGVLRPNSRAGEAKGRA
jgi:hypothetical protein